MPDHHKVPLLSAVGLSAGYAGSQVLNEVTLTVPRTGVVAVIGRNGAGKTTLLRALLGHMPKISGMVTFDGQDVSDVSPAALARRGIGYVPQEQVVFPTLTVRENLLIGVRALPHAQRSSIDEAFELFPQLAARPGQLAGTMSGGERKMVGMARALLAHPKLLVMDEPTEGVWHGVVDEILDKLRAVGQRAAVLLVEQHLQFALALADDVVVLDRGTVAVHEPATALADTPERLRRYLAV